jgi:peroxiredoxin
MMNKALEVGTEAPDFTLPSDAPAAAGEAPTEFVSLRELRGKNVILAFYPADWSAVCGDQLTVYNQMLPLFQKMNAELLGISVDGAFCHTAFREARSLGMKLLADFEPKGAVARLYGVYNDKDGVSERALFVVDKDGVIRYSFVSPVNVNPGANEILRTLNEIEANKGAETHG